MCLNRIEPKPDADTIEPRRAALFKVLAPGSEGDFYGGLNFSSGGELQLRGVNRGLRLIERVVCALGNGRQRGDVRN